MSKAQNPQQFRVEVREGADLRTYVLCKKDVKLRGSKIQRIIFFVSEGQRGGANAFNPVYDIEPHHDLPPAMLATVAQAMVSQLGMSPEDAVQKTAECAALLGRGDVQEITESISGYFNNPSPPAS